MEISDFVNKKTFIIFLLDLNNESIALLTIILKYILLYGMTITYINSASDKNPNEEIGFEKVYKMLKVANSKGYLYILIPKPEAEAIKSDSYSVAPFDPIRIKRAKSRNVDV